MLAIAIDTKWLPFQVTTRIYISNFQLFTTHVLFGFQIEMSADQFVNSG